MSATRETSSARSYRLSPRDRTGWMFGLSLAQLAVVAVGVAGGALAMVVVSVPAGVVLLVGVGGLVLPAGLARRCWTRSRWLHDSLGRSLAAKPSGSTQSRLLAAVITPKPLQRWLGSNCWWSTAAEQGPGRRVNRSRSPMTWVLVGVGNRPGNGSTVRAVGTGRTGLAP